MDPPSVSEIKPTGDSALADLPVLPQYRTFVLPKFVLCALRCYPANVQQPLSYAKDLFVL